jgi:hypothetical protein
VPTFEGADLHKIDSENNTAPWLLRAFLELEQDGRG